MTKEEVKLGIEIKIKGLRLGENQEVLIINEEGAVSETLKTEKQVNDFVKANIENIDSFKIFVGRQVKINATISAIASDGSVKKKTVRKKKADTPATPAPEPPEE